MHASLHLQIAAVAETHQLFHNIAVRAENTDTRHGCIVIVQMHKYDVVTRPDYRGELHHTTQ